VDKRSLRYRWDSSAQISDTACAACANTDQGAFNSGTCTCGEATCTPGTGLLCHSASNTCAPGTPCANGDGTAANGDECQCGSAGCTSDTFCVRATSKCLPCHVGEELVRTYCLPQGTDLIAALVDTHPDNVSQALVDTHPDSVSQAWTARSNQCGGAGA